MEQLPGKDGPVFFAIANCAEKHGNWAAKTSAPGPRALINDDLLIDMPPDNYLHKLYYGLDFSKVRTLIFTHSHSDHCLPADLETLRDPFSHTYPGEMQVYGNDKVEQKVLAQVGNLGGEKRRFRFHRIMPNETIVQNPYTITALRALHAKNETCLFYHIACGEKAVLYAHDTGAFSAENIETLKRSLHPLKLVSLDCTMQSVRDGKNHMGLEDDAEQKELLLREGLADENTIFVLNHFSHNGGWLHDEITERAAKYDMIAAWDGMTVNF